MTAASVRGPRAGNDTGFGEQEPNEHGRDVAIGIFQQNHQKNQKSQPVQEYGYRDWSSSATFSLLGSKKFLLPSCISAAYTLVNRETSSKGNILLPIPGLEQARVFLYPPACKAVFGTRSGGAIEGSVSPVGCPPQAEAPRDR